MASAASQTAPEAPPSANTCALATWLVPGAGHFMLGDRRTALIGFLLIQGLYLAGVMLSDGMFLQVLPPEMRGRFAGALTPEAGNLGALLLQARQVGFGDGIPRPFPGGLHAGMMLTSAAGVLNLLLAARLLDEEGLLPLLAHEAHELHPTLAHQQEADDVADLGQALLAAAREGVEQLLEHLHVHLDGLLRLLLVAGAPPEALEDPAAGLVLAAGLVGARGRGGLLVPACAAGIASAKPLLGELEDGEVQLPIVERALAAPAAARSTLDLPA